MQVPDEKGLRSPRIIQVAKPAEKPPSEEDLARGRRLRDARAARGLTQKELSKLADDYDVSQLTRAENGKQKIKGRFLTSLCKALGVTKEYFDGTEPLPPAPSEIGQPTPPRVPVKKQLTEVQDETGEAFASYPNLAALMRTSLWAETPHEIRERLKGAAFMTGDVKFDLWKALRDEMIERHGK